MQSVLLWFAVLACCFAKFIELSSVEEILNSPYTLLYFYTPDCKYCNNFNPDFVYLHDLYQHNNELTFAKVDARDNGQLTDLFGVNSYPTIKLYDTFSKKVAHFQEKRTLENLERFITEFSSALPDRSNVQLQSHTLTSLAELDSLILQEERIVLAFVSKLSPGWLKYYYPSHFFQELANNDTETAFALVFADETGSDILQRYQVSNFPSLMMISSEGIKTFNTFSTNSMTNNNLNEEDLALFLKLSDDLLGCFLFKDTEELINYSTSREYEGHRHVKPGMNVGVGKSLEQSDIDSEYAELVRHLEL